MSLPETITTANDAAILARILRMRTPGRAMDIIARHGSLGRVLSLACEAPTPLSGVSEPERETLAYVAETTRRVASEQLRAAPLCMGSWDKVVAWARVNIGHDTRESIIAIYLDNNNALIGHQTLGQGTINHCAVYPREIARSALLRDANAVILIHNHPSGGVEPSRADIDMTRDIAKALAPLGISVHDHLIVSATSHASLRALGHM